MAKKPKKGKPSNSSVKWELSTMPTGCFVETLEALTPEFGCKESGNYRDKVTIKNTRRYLCSSWIEGSNCIGKGDSPSNSRSWDYLISFLKDKNGNRSEFIQKKMKSGIVDLNNKEDVLILFLEVHKSTEAGKVADKAKWLQIEVIEKYINKTSMKDNYKIFWLKDGTGYPSKDGERKIRQAQVNYNLQIRSGQSIDLDKEF